jgi:tetratricopeptide (TPR) repeat protein
MKRGAPSACVLLACGTWVAAAGESASADWSRALDCYHARRYAEARERFQQIAGQRAADPELDFYLGRLALWFDEGPLALVHLERAVGQAPREARLHNALGDAYGLMAQSANVLAKLSWAGKCLAAYERAVQLDPHTLAFRWSLLGYHCVAPRLVGGGAEKAQAQSQAIARLDPAEGRVARATLALAESRYAAAFAEFEAVLAAAPDDFVALYQIGRCAALSGREIDRGIRALRRCLELAPPAGPEMPTHAFVHHRLGLLLRQKGLLAAAAEAEAAVRRALPDFRPQKIVLRL